MGLRSWRKLAASVFSLSAIASLLLDILISKFLKMHILKGSKFYISNFTLKNYSFPFKKLVRFGYLRSPRLHRGRSIF